MSNVHYTKVNSPHLKNTRENCGIRKINYTTKEILTMNTLPTDLHKFIEYGLGGETFQGFVSRYEEKYSNSALWQQVLLPYLYQTAQRTLARTCLPNP